ncbi:MAG: ferritin family protein [Anaerolineae bacterium]
MTGGKNVALSALTQAIRLEKEGREFYLKAAEWTSDPKGQEMFRSLAEDEELHLKIVQRQYDALADEGKWVRLPEVEKVEPIDLDKPLFPKGREALKEAIPEEASQDDALLFALGLENNSFELYRKAVQETEEPVGKEMYLFLANTERHHFDVLMANYEALYGYPR